MIQVRFKDIDPDSGEVSQDKLICTCENLGMAKWVAQAIELSIFEEGDPNREVYIKQESDGSI